jgi:DNA-binding transcriptional LysR family regulator
MSLTFRQLEIIRAVGRAGSVTGGAAILGISQPAISVALRDCKAAAGFPLFVRRQGRLQPTSETGILLADLDRVFDGVDRINRLVEDLATATIGTLQVAATPTLADNLVPLAVAAFGRERANVRITVQAMDNFAVVRQVNGSLVDFGLALSPLTRFEGGAQDVCASELICAVHPGHPLAGRRSVGPADLEPYRLISFSRSLPLGALVEESFRAAGLRRRIAVEVNQSSVACAMARAGAGVAVIDPFWGLGSPEPGIARIPLRPPVEIRAQILEPPGRPLSRLSRLFLDELRAAARALGLRRG